MARTMNAADIEAAGGATQAQLDAAEDKINSAFDADGNPIAAKLVGEAAAQVGDTLLQSFALPDRTIRQARTFSSLPKMFNWEAMRNWHAFCGQMAAGLNFTHDLLLAGDSYTHLSGQNGSDRYAGALTKRLQTALGDAGAGWIGFGYPVAGFGAVNGAADFSRYPVTFSGTGWSANYAGAVYSPDISAAQSQTAGDRISVSLPANTAELRLLYGADAAGANPGQVRYSYDNGATWAGTITLSGNSAGSAALGAVPASAFTLIIEIVGANRSRLAGLRHVNTALRGLRVNKIAATGGRASNYANLQDAIHRGQLALLGGASQTIMIMLGANDQGASRTKAQFKADIAAMVNSYRFSTSTRNTGKDVLLVAEPENNRTANTIAMREYQMALMEIAYELDCAFLNLQPFFGSRQEDYAAVGRTPLMATDLLHPEPDTGGKLMANVIGNALLSGTGL